MIIITQHYNAETGDGEDETPGLEMPSHAVMLDVDQCEWSMMGHRERCRVVY